MLFNGDGDPDREPVPHHRQKVREDLTEVVSARERTDEVDDDAHSRPDKPRDLRRRAPEDLEVDAGDVGREDCVGDDAKGDDYAEEATEAA